MIPLRAVSSQSTIIVKYLEILVTLCHYKTLVMTHCECIHSIKIENDKIQQWNATDVFCPFSHKTAVQDLLKSIGVSAFLHLHNDLKSVSIKLKLAEFIGYRAENLLESIIIIWIWCGNKNSIILANIINKNALTCIESPNELLVKQQSASRHVFSSYRYARCISYFIEL